MTDGDLRVEAELLEAGPVPDLPGDTLSIPLSRYGVLRVLSGSCPHPVILVGHSFQDRMGFPFEPGVRHRMALTKTFPEHAVLLNPYAATEPGLPVYYCSSLTVLDDQQGADPGGV